MERMPATVGNRGNGHSDRPQGMLSPIKSSEVAREFIQPPDNLMEAIARTDLLDQNELNDAVTYIAQLREFDMEKEIEDFVIWLVGKPAIGGYSRKEALMAAIGIAVPGWTRHSKGKKEAEEIKEMNDLKRSRQERKEAREVPD